VKRIRPAETPITLEDYRYALHFAQSHPLKAHLTGPVTLARASTVDSQAPYHGRSDPALVMDLAQALGQEARSLVEIGAEIVQIDEPLLGDGFDLGLAFQALSLLIEIGRIPFPALHICGNVTSILKEVLESAPVKMVSIEGSWLNYPSLSTINRADLARCGKQIGLGCIQVMDQRIEKLVNVQDFLDKLVLRLGEENIWAVMPNCGLRALPHLVAYEKLRVMVNGAKSLLPNEYRP
jgi:5-methyltetrahydropteroyltriglutamate--homocysteine methyltransferase